MCKHGDTVVVGVPALDSLLWKVKPLDRCIAPIVQALNNAGVLTANSCCGHGNGPGGIILHDGRELIIQPAPLCGSIVLQEPG